MALACQVEEPSTASFADVTGLPYQARSAPKSRHKSGPSATRPINFAHSTVSLTAILDLPFSHRSERLDRSLSLEEEDGFDSILIAWEPRVIRRSRELTQKTIRTGFWITEISNLNRGAPEAGKCSSLSNSQIFALADGAVNSACENWR
jgi:hypothetical protein